MKIFIPLISLFAFSKSFSQDSLKIRLIDSLVNSIVHANLPVRQDSMIQNYPALGLYMKTYTTMAYDDKELKKYVQRGNSSRQENGITKQMVSGTAFYYDQFKLIKVEEYMIEDGKSLNCAYYYLNDKCFYNTLQSEKANERGMELLKLSKAILITIPNH